MLKPGKLYEIIQHINPKLCTGEILLLISAKEHIVDSKRVLICKFILGFKPVTQLFFTGTENKYIKEMP